MAKYVSRRKELCIVVRPSDREIDEHRRVKHIPGKRAEFFNGRYETYDPEIIECLKTHPYRNKKFSEITESDERAIQKAKQPGIVTGILTTEGHPKPEETPVEQVEREVATRPEDVAAISPELIRVIDERINSALSVIVDLLKKDEVKEEKIITGKPTKTFKCPFCGEPFQSGFAVGKHKKVCPKRT